MNYANDNQSLPSIFDGLGIAARSVENLVPLLDPAFQRPVHARLIDQLAGGSINARKSGQRIFTIFRKEDDYPYATIQGRQANGSFLNLALNESDFAAIPVGNMIKGTSGAVAKVESKDLGQLTISFVANSNGNTSFVAADFAVSSSISDRGAIGNIQNRKELEFVMGLPEGIQNVIPQYDMTVEILHDDMMSETHLTGLNGQKRYANMKEVEALGRLNRQYVTRTLDNIPAVLGGNEPVAASLLNQILTMGGGQSTLGATETTTEGFWQDTIERFVSTGAFSNGEILGIFGQKLLGNFQKNMKEYLVTAGKDNTIGGDTVKGIDVYEYAFGGVSMKVMLEPIYSNIKLWGDAGNGFSKRANTGMLIATEKVKTQQGEVLPFMASRYFSNTEDIRRSVANGMMDSKGNDVKEGNNGKKAATVNFTLDKVDYFNNPRATFYIGE